MKITVIEETLPPPPRRVLLDLSEEEISLLYQFTEHYFCEQAVAVATEITAAGRFLTRLKNFKGKAVYPFTTAFV